MRGEQAYLPGRVLGWSLPTHPSWWFLRTWGAAVTCGSLSRSDPAAISAGWRAWFQTDKSIVSVVGSTTTSGSLLVHVLLFWVWDCWDWDHFKLLNFSELFFHLEHYYRKMPESSGRRFSRTEHMYVTGIQMNRRGIRHSQDPSGLWVEFSYRRLPWFIGAFSHWWAFAWFPVSGCYEQCHWEHSHTGLLVPIRYLGVGSCVMLPVWTHQPWNQSVWSVGSTAPVWRDLSLLFSVQFMGLRDCLLPLILILCLVCS